MSSSPSPSLAIGLTGGIGSGKTTVTDQFKEHGIVIIDTDAIAHALTAPSGQAIPAIRQTFGDAAIAENGAMDRAWMRELVFTNSNAKKQLEQILHPLIRQECEEQTATANSPYVIFAVPLLVESGNWRQRVQRIAVVDCSEETQIARVMKRNQFRREQVEAIMRAQATRAQRLASADDIIDNETDLERVRTQVDALHLRYLQLAHEARIAALS